LVIEKECCARDEGVRFIQEAPDLVGTWAGTSTR
jgi:hypothetical protein